jgi:hypothetical protein
MIKFNEVTWYSKLAAIIFFVGVLPSLTFYMGMQYNEAENMVEIGNVSVGTALKESSVSLPREGCLEKNNQRTCVLMMGDDKLYTFRYDGKQKVEVYKNNVLLQTIALQTEIPDLGSITGFMISTDVNFDGLDDLAIKTCEGATGNVCYEYYLFNPQTEKFEYSKEFTSAGGSPDAATKEIRSSWNNGCAGDCFSNRTYKVINDKPVLILEVVQEFDEKKQVFVKVTKELKNGVFVVSTSTVAQ